MSLNGLEDVQVIAAYQAALAEAGGWFLLKYTSRDAVEVLTRGTGGAADARGAIARYEENSPLYGFLLYRRRKVLIKYVPEGTSRLLQARVSVHFTAVTEKFTPHDTTISITTADELSDAALTSACSLHTAAPSSSSSSSSRHKLDEITEDAEEGHSTAGDSATTAKPAPPTSTNPVVIEPTASAENEEHTATSPETKLVEEGKLTPEFSHVTVETVTENEKENSLPERSPQRDSFKNYDSLFENGPDPRLSSQTTRPALSDLYAELYAQYNKPKVKLGPRPKASLDIKRPHTSGNGAQSPARPVSSLPAGLRAANRKTLEPKRPKSRDSSAVPSIAVPPPPPVPPVPDIPRSPSYPPKSPASVRSMPVHAYGGTKSGGASAEKQRLMKALEIRKRQMKARKAREEQEAGVASANATAEAEENAKTAGSLTHEDSPVETVEGADANPNTIPNEEAIASSKMADQESTGHESPIPEDPKPALIEDSGVGMTSCQSETDDIHSAASACSPTSAQTQDSSCAPSTRPSSISEDDHQTQHEVKSEVPVPSSAQTDAEPIDDEGESVESSPTVVPEATTEVPVQADHAPLAVPQASASDDYVARRSKRESMILMPAKEPDVHLSRRRTNRESMLFLPPPDADSTQSRRQKRESMIMTAPMLEAIAGTKEKRRVVLDSIHVSAENSEAEYLSDDSFMEELQSAKFEEALPVSVSVSKSPITPFFPRKPSMSERSTPQRSASQQHVKPGRLSPEQLGSRKSSGPWLAHANSDTVVVAKKINVSSGISQRIKALAEKSNRESSASVSSLATPDASTSIVAQRKSSFFSTPPAGNSPNEKPVQRFTRVPFVANKSNSTTPDNKPVLQPPPLNTERIKPPVYNLQGSEKPESVQVTARIVRDPRVQKPTLTMPTDKTPLELHKSPIIIDHQVSTRPSSRSKPNPPKAEPTSPRPPSSSSHTKDASIALPRSSSESSWRSFGRRLSESKVGAGPRSRSAHSFDSNEERQEKKEKKDSRTSKLFKRMSSAASISRKNSATSSMQEEVHTSLPSLREPPPPVQVGDLNIQFPDTLLWKRRWVEIDASGSLVLSLSKSNEQSKGITKRFHLTEFRTPYAPDQDRQELPNSVVLDFIDGRTLQCACETHVAQAQVLQILREAHDAWRAYDQGQ
ncbi:hypothetical protein K458DRAFT_444734 [Lentithecium fluviatile CBS 122367]|uniref:ADF-H domain-containing protein n=1 Tax=Lentithecium fluviatile CBS 122367 TaxID=1168545 RepID=A0A6G1IU93_9PLEO|nr:hypothetical protein K458DRAFT_444734 [Lentithecium fluviatile CBS 122367]